MFRIACISLADRSASKYKPALIRFAPTAAAGLALGVHLVIGLGRKVLFLGLAAQ